MRELLVIIKRIKYNIFYKTLMGGICMGSYLNPGNFSFKGSLRSKIYVDMTSGVRSAFKTQVVNRTAWEGRSESVRTT